MIIVLQGVDALDSRFGGLRSSSNVLQSPRRLPPRGPPTNCMTLVLEELLILNINFYKKS